MPVTSLEVVLVYLRYFLPVYCTDPVLSWGLEVYFLCVIMSVAIVSVILTESRFFFCQLLDIDVAELEIDLEKLLIVSCLCAVEGPLMKREYWKRKQATYPTLATLQVILGLPSIICSCRAPVQYSWEAVMS